MAWFTRNPNPLEVDIARLYKENAELRAQVEALENQVKTILDNQQKVIESFFDNNFNEYLESAPAFERLTDDSAIGDAVNDYLDGARLRIRID